MLIKSRKPFSLSISFSFSLKLKNVLQLAFTYSNSTIKAKRAIYLKIVSNDTGKTYSEVFELRAYFPNCSSVLL